MELKRVYYHRFKFNQYSIYVSIRVSSLNIIYKYNRNYSMAVDYLTLIISRILKYLFILHTRSLT